MAVTAIHEEYPLVFVELFFLSRVDVFRRESSNHNRIPRTTQALNNIITGAMTKAKEVSITDVYYSVGHCLV